VLNIQDGFFLTVLYNAMSKAELQIELRQLRKEHLQGGRAVSSMNVADLRTEVAAIRHIQGRSQSHPSMERTIGRPSSRPMHNATVEDEDEDGEGIRTPAVPEKKPITKDTRGRASKGEEHIAKMVEAARKAREAKKANKDVEKSIKQPELSAKSERKSVHFCNCPSCPDKH